MTNLGKQAELKIVPSSISSKKANCGLISKLKTNWASP